MKQKLLLIILFFCLSIVELLSQSSTARFLYWSPSAEITAQGGAGVAIVNNAFSAYYNPASFAFSKNPGIASSFMQPFSSFQNTSQVMLSLSYPTKEIGTFALSLNSFWIENAARTGPNSPDILGAVRDQPKLFEPTNYQIKASYANKITNNIAVGVSASILHIALSPLPTAFERGSGITTTVLLDVGFLVTDLWQEGAYRLKFDNINTAANDNLSPGVAIGLSFLNLGPKISFIDDAQGDPPPSVALLGFSYTPLYSNLVSSRLLVDLEKRIYDSNALDYIHLGGEVLLYSMIYLRSGYAINNINSDQSYPTFGLGINYLFLSANISRYKKYPVPTWQFDTKINLEF
ncbi:MAG: PorV/PorQ family protein [Ignavibacteria bacterium]|nr:PorV/PorQ family protein [Ignavibacteria bacterium]